MQHEGLVQKTIVLFVGNYGSGKTEVAVNFAVRAVEDGGRRVRIADLDLVNPYFRCREARVAMEALGIEVVLPPAEYMHADLPILAPEVKGMIQQPDGLAVLDVGGDDAGATVVASLAPAFPAGAFEVLQVVNGFRPFTDEPAGVLRIMAEIEAAAKVAVTGLVANSHLMDDTTEETIYAGYDLARAVGAQRDLPVRFVTAESRLADRLDPARIDGVPVLAMTRTMLPPWRRAAPLGSSNFLLSGRL